MDPRPRLALTLGDPAGIGPEVALAALADARVRAAARLVALGPGELRPAAVSLAEPGALDDGSDAQWLATESPGAFEVGRVQASCGRAALAALRAGHELALAGAVDALVTAPVSKEALALAGERVEGQTELLGRWCGARDFEMLAVAGKLRVMLLSRHLPLREALELVRPDRVLAKLRLLDRALRELGFDAPRLALAGLNPHAGENGLIGDDEARFLAPALERARSDGLDVAGPVPPDSVFVAGLDGRFDGILALYHDQAFIPVKLAGRRDGLTAIAGLPYLRVSPAHGTAMDIAGRGRADPENLVQALLQAAEWARRRRSGTSSKA